jgi:basic membrane protein A
MKSLKKSLCLYLILILSIFLLVGCGGQGSGQEEPGDEGSMEGDSTSRTEEKPKVALLLPGPINDGDWNAIAYEGLRLIGEKYGAEIAYAEHVAASDMEEYFHNFAVEGFEIIIGHGFEFADSALKVAEDFPNVKFALTSSDVNNNSNVASINISTNEQGFVAGAAAALLTKSDIVAALGGMDIPPISSFIEGFEVGVNFVKPDVKALVGLTGSFEDAAKMKEMMIAYIQQGIDVGAVNANQAGLGGLEALEAADKIIIGVNNDQSEIAPNNCPVSVMQSYPFGMSYFYEEIINGRFEPKTYNLGLKENAIYLNYNESYDIPNEAKAELDNIVKDIIDGKIKIN